MNYAESAAATLPTNAACSSCLDEVEHELALLCSPITGWHALHGLSIGTLRGLSPGCDLDIRVEQVFEETADLAVADRVAYLLAARSGRNHLVLAGANGYVIATVSTDLDWAAAMRLEHANTGFRVTSVGTEEGVLPVLLPIAG